MGILLNSVSEFEGYKVKIEKSFEIREHFDVSHIVIIILILLPLSRKQRSSNLMIHMVIILLVNGMCSCVTGVASSLTTLQVLQCCFSVLVHA